MHAMRKTLCLVLLCFSLCGLGMDAGAQDRVLRRGGAGDPDTLDPHKFINAFEGTILTDLFMGLMVNSADDRPVPGAASSYTVSDDGLVITFDMRDGITWSDGVLITAGDFVFSFRRTIDPATASSSGSMLRPIVNAEAISRGDLPPSALGVDAPDPDTFVIRLRHPAPYLIEVLSFVGWPAPRHAIEAHGDAWIRPENMVVNGPYTLDEWIPNTHVKLVKNSRFYDAANLYFDTVYHIPSEDMRTGLSRFRSGELDAQVFFPPDQLSIIQEEMPEALRIATSMSMETIAFNLERPPFDDVRVRQALSMAIDRETLTQRILRTGEQPAYGYVPLAALNYPRRAEAAFKDLPYEQRLTRARALLTEAGFGPDNPLRVPYRFNTQDAQTRLGAALAAMWTRVGVETELINSERRVLAADRFQGNYAVARYLRVGATYDPAFTLLYLHSDLSDFNISRYHNPAFNQMFEQGWQSADPAVRAQYLFEAERIALADQPMIPLYYYASRRLVQPHIGGWTDNARGIHPSRWLFRR